MCGIIAHLAFDAHSRIELPHLKALNDLLTHRGPDDEGVYVKDHVALAMRRLSIVDLSHGQQPMVSSDGRFAIVFNGEIYNHAALRLELIALGFPLKTHSDTEVLLYAYAAWGSQCLAKLNGMFAFVVWDHQSQELFIARDRMGVKPLYYAMDAKRVMFASELTPIARSGFFPLRFNHKAIADYLSYWYICEPDTIFQGMRQLPPGHYAIVSAGRMIIQQYWQIPTEKEGHSDFDQAAQELEALLKSAVRLRLKADVPTGTFLSGGIDSGLVTAFAAKETQDLHSFAIGFKERSYNETPLAQLTARKHGVALDVHVMEDVTPHLIETIIGSFDEPLGNASYVPTYLLARAARSKMKVVLTGDGGDELFGGYPTYQAPQYQQMWRGLPAWSRALIKSGVQKIPVSHKRISLDYRLKQLMQGIDANYQRGHFTWREVVSLQMQQTLWRPELWQEHLGGHDPFQVSASHYARAKDLSVANQLMYTDLNTFLLNDHLRKVDRMTMAHGLEARCPFMDFRVVEFAMRLSPEHKVNFRQTKKILKAVAQKHLPAAVVNGKKKGLTSPIASWLCNELKEYMCQELQNGVVGQMFQRAVVQALINDHLQLRKDNSRPLWALLTLQVWAKKHAKNFYSIG